VHCHPGQDRTGILVALTLMIAGVGDTYRQPASYTVQYHGGSGWADVPDQVRTPATPLPNLNTVAFTPVTTDRLRVVVTPTGDFGVGLEEIQVLDTTPTSADEIRSLVEQSRTTIRSRSRAGSGCWPSWRWRSSCSSSVGTIRRGWRWIGSSRSRPMRAWRRGGRTVVARRGDSLHRDVVVGQAVVALAVGYAAADRPEDDLWLHPAEVGIGPEWLAANPDQRSQPGW
jgi:hypothetical protein